MCVSNNSRNPLIFVRIFCCALYLALGACSSQNSSYSKTNWAESNRHLMKMSQEELDHEDIKVMQRLRPYIRRVNVGDELVDELQAYNYIIKTISETAPNIQVFEISEYLVGSGKNEERNCYWFVPRTRKIPIKSEEHRKLMEAGRSLAVTIWRGYNFEVCYDPNNPDNIKFTKQAP